MKKIKKGLLIGVLIILGNLVYYVFIGQNKSEYKLKNKQELNFYECLSIYQMHIAVWSLGWPLSPVAAKECFLLHFPIKKDTILFKNKLDSPKLQNAIKESKTKLSWNGNKDYALNSKEHNVAIAINPCTISKTDKCIEVTSLMQYPKWSNTNFNLGYFTIHVQEGLFRYLQDKHWLSCYTAKYELDV